MAKVLSGFPLVALMALSAYAQSPAIDEKESIVPVIIFLFLFVGSCVGFFVYLWWNEKKKRQGEQGEKPL